MTKQNPDSRMLQSLIHELMRVDDVQAAGESEYDGKPCIKVYFSDEASLKESMIPESKHGVAIIKVVSGSIQAQ